MESSLQIWDFDTVPTGMAIRQYHPSNFYSPFDFPAVLALVFSSYCFMVKSTVVFTQRSKSSPVAFVQPSQYPATHTRINSPTLAEEGWAFSPPPESRSGSARFGFAGSASTLAALGSSARVVQPASTQVAIRMLAIDRNNGFMLTLRDIPALLMDICAKMAII